MDSPVEVLRTLAHEIVHETVGTDQGHKGKFVKLCKKIELVAPWTATTSSPELLESLAIYARKLGPYPHARLNAHNRSHGDYTVQHEVCAPHSDYALMHEARKGRTVVRLWTTSD